MLADLELIALWTSCGLAHTKMIHSGADGLSMRRTNDIHPSFITENWYCAYIKTMQRLPLHAFPRFYHCLRFTRSWSANDIRTLESWRRKEYGDVRWQQTNWLAAWQIYHLSDSVPQWANITTFPNKLGGNKTRKKNYSTHNRVS